MHWLAWHAGDSDRIRLLLSSRWNRGSLAVLRERGWLVECRYSDYGRMMFMHFVPSRILEEY